MVDRVLVSSIYPCIICQARARRNVPKWYVTSILTRQCTHRGCVTKACREVSARDMTRKLNFVAVMPKLFDEIRESWETWVDATTKLRREDFVTILMVQTSHLYQCAVEYICCGDMLMWLIYLQWVRFWLVGVSMYNLHHSSITPSATFLPPPPPTKLSHQ